MDLQLDEGLSLNKQTKAFLLETAKWSKFLAIIGFIMVGFMVIMGLSFGSIMGVIASMDSSTSMAMEMIPMGLFGVFYVILALIYFFPIWYLFKFATKMKNALLTDDESELTEAFSNLKSHYKFVGILTIIMLSLYALMFLFTMLAFVIN